MTDNEKRAHDIAITMLSAKLQTALSFNTNAALEFINKIDHMQLYLNYYNDALKKLD